MIFLERPNRAKWNSRHLQKDTSALIMTFDYHIEKKEKLDDLM